MPSPGRGGSGIDRIVYSTCAVREIRAVRRVRAAALILHMRAHAHVPLSAILLISGSVLCFSTLDAVIKVLTQRCPVPFLVWARYGIQAIAMLLWLLPQMGTSLFRT